MRSYTLATAAAVAALANAEPTRTKNEAPRQASLPVVTASGNAFYTEDGERFYIRGIDYQPGGSSANEDPIADPDVCLRDIKLFKDMGVNTIRIYSTDNSVNHDECMNALADAGIYLMADVNNKDYSINREDPAPSYNDKYLQSVFATIDEFQKYSNTLAFFSGNEVIDKTETTNTAPYVKALTRDMRNYIRKRGYRQIPVGYSAADLSQSRWETAQYFNCGADEERSDFFAFNDYALCAPNTFQGSDWPQKVKQYSNYGLPIFLSEWGCNKNERDFEELKALMSDDMSAVYSGGLMYEYSLEDSDYGIVSISGSGEPKKEKEYAAFKSALAKYPAPKGDGGASPTQSKQECPPMSNTWDLGKWGSSSLPEMPQAAEKYFTDGAGKGPGLDGEGSQTAGDGNFETATPGQGSGSGSGGGSGGDDDEGAGARPAPMDGSIFVVTGLVSVFTFVGTLLL